MDPRIGIQDYWNEAELLPSITVEEEGGSRSCDEGEIEAEWLEDAGLGMFSTAFQQGREVPPNEIDEVLLEFSTSQAEVIKRRVFTLNNTVRQRLSRNKNKKTDVRDLFKDVEIRNNSHSRSATPDSLDSGNMLESSSPPYTTTIRVTDDSEQVWNRRPLSRAPSAPPYHPVINLPPNPKKIVARGSPPAQPDLFRHYVPDVAGSVSEGLRLVRYQYVGTLPRHRSGSDPLFLDASDENDTKSLLTLLSSSSRLSRSHGNLVESFWEESSQDNTDRTWIDSLDPADVARLKPLIHVDVTAVFDAERKNPHKRKPIKNNKKTEGNVFGLSLGALLEKDERLFKDDTSEHPFVPVIFQMLTSHLERQDHLKEEGLLRVAGVKNRIDVLTETIENEFYQQRSKVEAVLYHVSPHDVTSALKKLLRDLPEPLLTYKLLNMFYYTQSFKNEARQKVALNLLVLLLPRENQATLRFFFRFLSKLVELEAYNKMGYHSIATIVAPSLFPPRLIANTKEDVQSQVLLAENCIKLTETLLREGDSLWLVPRKLILQLRALNDARKGGRKENSKPRLFGAPRYKAASRRISKDDVIIIEASQFGLSSYPIRITESMTARDVVLKIINEVMKMQDGTLKDGGKHVPRGRMKPLTELAPAGLALSCVLSCAVPETALQTHILYERGGNIEQREVDHCAVISSILSSNPNASWRLECRHRNCPKR